MPQQSLQRLIRLLVLTSKNIRRVLLRLSRLISTAAGLDAILTTLQYTATFVHSQLVRLLEYKYEKLAISIASKASETMLPGEALVATIESPHLTLTEWCASVKEFASASDDARTFLRLWGLVNIYSWAREVYEQPHRDPTIKFLVWARILASAGYQVLENGAYLTKKSILRGDTFTKSEPIWWVWSSRFWVAEVTLELLRLFRIRQLKFNEELGAEKLDLDDKVVKAQSQELESQWWKDVYSTAGWVIPSLNCSFYDAEAHSPVNNDTWIGVSGMVPGMIALRDAWEETA